MKKSVVLTKIQKHFLALFAQNQPLAKEFYLSGGTALAEYYLPYRYSEDLDFFSENEIDIKALIFFLRSNKNELGYTTFDLNTSFNRNIFMLNSQDSFLKTEFTYFPFPPIEKPIKHQGLRIDSLLDIAVNKLFTIYQKPRSRDYMDLYMIIKNYRFSIRTLMEKAGLKFDWWIDKLKLGAQFLLAEEVKDYPKLIKPMNDQIWQEFFRREAKKLGKDIIQ